MNANIKGAKGGEKKARQPVVAVDSAQSKTFIKILYGLSEGEVQGLANGLKSVYLDDTPIQDDNSNSNFQNITTDFRAGTNDQTYIEGFPDISSETAVGIELKSGTPWVRAISNTTLDAVRIRLKWGALREQNASNGDVNGYTIEYAVDVQTDGGTWTEVLKTKVSDKTSANYERSHRIDLPKASRNWQIRVRRITPNSTSEYIGDKMYIEAITEVIDLKLSYPNTALFGLQYDAETFSNVAKIAIDLKGVKLKVPSNYDAENRTYTGIWDGTFKRAYSNNPAWIYYDICTSKRYALGDRLTSSMLDKWSLYRLGQYCDQLVDDGKGGQEPRFTCNIYLQSTEDAYAILTKLAGVFRAISFWDGNSIICDADIPQDTYFTYTRANVIDGHFEYSGTRARDRHTVAKVAWDNPNNRYKTEYEFVRDEKAIAKLGVKIVDIDAWGCTSQGQAQRAGLWALKSEQLETRSVSFKVGLDGYIPQPGKIIEIADELFAGRANGGRVSAVSADHKTVTIDRDNVVCRAGDRLVVNGEDGRAQARIVASITGRKITVTVAFDSIAAENVWAVDAQDLKTMKFRVMSITQDDKHQFSINALQYESSKYDAIDFGAHIDDRPISIINPTVQAPVKSVSITAETMVQQGLSVATMLITWPQATDATKYLIEWRKDDGSWLKLPITGNNSVEVQGIYSGNYEARVTAINAFDVSSMPTYSMLTTLKGKAGKPPKLAFINAVGILFGMKLTWGFPSVGALDTAYTEIQVSPDGVANIAQLGLFAYPTTTHSIQGMQPNLTQKYRGRLIDRIGNVGDWSTWATGTTSADATAVLDILNGKITESQLHKDLQTKIDTIEIIDGSIAGLEDSIQSTKDLAQKANDDLTVERNDRITAINSTVSKIDTEIKDRKTAVQQVADVANKANSDLATEKQDRITAINSTVSKIDTEIKDRKTAVQQVADVANKANSDLATEKQDRITAINSTVTKIDTEIADRKTAITQVSDGLTTQIKDGDTAVLQVVDTVKKSSDAGISAVQSDIKVVADNLTISATKIDGVYAQVNPPLVGSTTDLIGSEGGFAGVWSEQSARIENDMAIGIRIDTTVAQIENVQALAQSEVTARVKGDEATVQKIDSYIASNDSALSSVRQTANSAVSKSDANASSITALDSRVVTAESNASTAKTNAASAVTKADTAVTTAGSASTMAQQASATATSAKSTADTAISNSATALSTSKAASDASSAASSKVDAVEAKLGNYATTGAVSAVDSKVSDLDGKLTATTTKVDGVYAQVNPPLIGSTTDLIGSEGGFAGVWSEQSARIENDMAIGIRIDTTVAQIENVQALAQSEVTARVKGDEATVQKIDSYIASNDSALSSVRQTANSAVSKSDANASSITALDSRVVTAESNASTAKTNAASAVTKADTAVTTAGSASTMAQQASATATSAKSTADTAISNSATALSTSKAASDASSAASSKVDAVEAKLGNYATTGAVSAVDSKVSDLDGKLTATTTKVDGVYAQVNPPLIGSTTDLIGSEGGFAGVWSEQSARIENDMAIGIRIDTTVAQIENVQALAQSEVTARVKGDEATVQKIDSYIASNDSALSSVRQTANSAVSKSDANASSITALDSRVVTAESNASTAKTNAASAVTKADTAVTTAGSASTMAQQASATATSAKSTADTAISNSATALSTSKAASDASSAASSKVDAVEAKLGNYATTGAVSAVDSKVSDLDGKLTATTTKVDGVYAQVNPPLMGSTSDLIGSEGGYAGVWSEQSARIENDMAQSIRTDQVVAQMASNNAVYSQQIKATADALSANVTATTTLQTKVAGNTASIQTQQQSINGINLQYTLKLDSNGYVSGLGLMNDGKTSNMIINADQFALGNPAGTTGTTYPFIFRASAYKDEATGTIFPVGAYMKSAFLDYASIKTAHIEELSVKTTKIQNAAITNAKIGDLAVSTAKIQNAAITNAKIGDLEVDTLKIAHGSVTNAMLISGRWQDTSVFVVSNPEGKKVMSWVQMKGSTFTDASNSYCEIWLMRGTVQLVYKKFIPTDKLLNISDFFMHSDISNDSVSAEYWIKMRTYALNQSEHDRIQQAMKCDWMLLEAKR